MDLDRKSLFVILFLALLVVGATLSYYKNKQNKHAIKKIIKIPYKYNYSIKILKPNEFALVLHVTRNGNISQYIRVSMFCFNKLKNKLEQIYLTNSSISLPLVYNKPKHSITDYLYLKKAQLSACKKYIIKICDSFSGKCDEKIFNSTPWNYSINISFPDNYSVYVNITPKLVRFHTDKLIIYVRKYYLDPTTGKIKSQLIGKKMVTPTGFLNINKPQTTTLRFSWKYIGSYKAYIFIDIVGKNTNQTIYSKRFIISPMHLYLGKKEQIGNTSLVLNIEPGAKLTFNKPITLSTKNGEHFVNRVYKCKYRGVTVYCPGAVKLEIINNGNQSYNIYIPFTSILCLNSLLQPFPSSLGASVQGEASTVMYPGSTIEDYLVCYMINKSIPYLMYFKINVNGVTYEYDVLLSSSPKTTLFKYNYTILPVSPYSVELHVNISSVGTAPENIKLEEYCILNNGSIVNLGKSFTYSLETFETNPNIVIPVYYERFGNRCKSVIFDVCDTFTNKCSNKTISIEPWKYSIITSLLSNYSLEFILTPIQETLHRDVLKLMVNITEPNPYTGTPTIKNIKTITIVPKYTTYGQEPPTYNYTISWNAINSYIATINVKLIEVKTHKIIYETNYTVTPKILKIGYTYYSKNGTIAIVPAELFENNSNLTLEYFENNVKVNKTLNCKLLGSTKYCPVAIKLEITNIGKSSHTIVVYNDKIFCITNLKKVYTKSVGTGIFGPLSQTYAPGQSTYGYLYCYIRNNSRLSEMYFQVKIDKSIYEYVIKV